MPLLIDNKLLFFHAPKTAGTWVRRAVKESHIPHTELIFPIQANFNGHDTISFNDIAHMPPNKITTLSPKIQTFTLIRNPITWLQSVFKHHTSRGWSNTIIDKLCKAKYFNEFIYKYETNFPGLASRNMNLYMQNANHVGKTENTTQFLLDLLTKLNIKHNPQTIKNMPRINVLNEELRHKKLTVDTEYHPEILKLVKEKEHSFLAKHYPEALN